VQKIFSFVIIGGKREFENRENEKREK